MLTFSDLLSRVDQTLHERSAQWVDLRRDLHANPELSHREYKTTARLVATLQALGLSIHAREEGTGFYADLTPDGFDPAVHPTVAIRTDLDALPIQELSDTAYCSSCPGVMHACGHDVHMTVATAAAMAIQPFRDRLPGRVRFVYQHAEEVSRGGAPDMVSFGAIDGVDAILGVHCDPELDFGRIGLRVGHLTAAFDYFAVEILGTGGHGARPHHCVDPIRIGAQLLQALYQMPAQYFDARDPVVASVGMIHAGDSPNVIPDSIKIEGTLRTLTREARARLEPVLTQMIRGICTGHGAEFRLTLEHGAPSVVNHAAVIQVIEDAGRNLLGDAGIYQIPLPSMGAEDFSHYLEHIPGAMFRLGTAGVDARTRHLLHSARFDVDERAIPLGARVMARSALTLLQQLADGTLDFGPAPPARLAPPVEDLAPPAEAEELAPPAEAEE